MSVCVIAQPIHRSGLDRLREAGLTVVEASSPEPDVLGPLLREAEAVIVRNNGLSAAMIEAAPRLRVIAVHGTGTDRIDKDAAEKRGIAILNTPGTNARSVAEHALGLVLALARTTLPADAATRNGDFAYRERVRGLELGGRRLGLWGFGRIAQFLGGFAQALGMEVEVLSNHTEKAELDRRGFRKAASLPALLADADVLSLHAVPQAGVRLGAADLARMKPGAILVNTARGALIDEAALVDALRAGRLRGAALDVFTQEPLPASSPLCRCPNLVLTPHIGGSTEEALRRTALAAAGAVLGALGRAG